MPYIVMTPSVNKLEPAVKKKAFAFLEKLGENDALPGLHIERIQDVVDERVRTGRVDSFYRAVLFKVQGSGDEAHYVFTGIWPHDEAIEVARKTRLTINPVNGVAELIREAEQTAPPASHRPAVSVAPAAPEEADPVDFAASAASSSFLGSRGYLEQELVEDLGLEPTIAARAMEAPNKSALEVIAEEAAERALWQGVALLELESGISVVELKDKLALENYEPELSENEDDRLIEALHHPAAQISFSIVDDDDLRRAIDDGDFEAWRVFLHPEQRKYASNHYKGAFRLSGGAGTGKTVVLLHRARMLARAKADARVVLTTYTTNLAQALRTDLLRLDPEVTIAPALGAPGVFIAGVDALASAVLKLAGSEIAPAAQVITGTSMAQLGSRTARDAWKDAIDAAGVQLPSGAANVAFFESEYALTVLPNRIVDREGYFRVRRPGRGVRLDRAQRGAVWDVIEVYRRHEQLAGTADFEEVAAIAASHLDLRAPGELRLTDHVLVDEGQDLSPSRWQLLRALVAAGPDDLFIAEDSHQRIYGQRVTLGRLGIRITGRSRRLTLNYRTTAQNLAYAIGILEGGPFLDLEEVDESSAGYHSARRGPVPVPVAAASASDELDRAAKLIKTWLDEEAAVPETIAVLVRDGYQRDYVSRGLRDRGVLAREVDRSEVRPGLPVVMTMHRAKGTEFSNVLLFGLNEKSIPSKAVAKGLSEADRDDAMLRERSLLYVAATRARDRLAYSWSGDQSPLLPHPDDTAAQTPGTVQ